MLPPDRVGQSWTREIAASRLTAWLDLGDLHLVRYQMKGSASRSASILVLGCLYLGLLLKLEGKVKENENPARIFEELRYSNLSELLHD
jgi:hypothetical protein